LRAVLVENCPLAAGVQKKLSSAEVEILIFKISPMDDESKRWCSKGIFQVGA
jgi:hypothetical protein